MTEKPTHTALGVQQERTHNIGRIVSDVVRLVVRLGSIEANFAEHFA